MSEIREMYPSLSGTLTAIESMSGTLSGMSTMSGSLTIPEIIVPSGQFPGPYEYTPGEETQEVRIESMMASRNIVINAIPENYGRLTWAGNRLTVY